MRNAISMIVITALVAACGGRTNNDTGDTIPPILVSSSPANAALAVSVIAPITLEFDENIDVSSAVAGLRLRRRGATQPVPIRVRVDGSLVEILPIEPMAYGQLYTVSGVDLLDLSGNVSPLVTVTFRTSMNAMDQSISWSAGAVWNMTFYSADTYGMLAGFDSFSDPGLDLSWGTADDTMSYYYTYSSSSPYQLDRFIYTNGPGTDGAWHTSDDSIAYVQDWDYTPDGFVRSSQSYSGPGLDGIWGTGDDTVNGLQQYQLDSHGWPTRYVNVNPGVDTVFNTGDDLPYWYQDTTYDAEGRPTAYWNAFNPGLDMIWFTADDYTNYTENAWDSKGRMVSSTSYADALGTSVSSSVSFVYDANDRLATSIYRDALGMIVQYMSLERDANGLIVRRVWFSTPGLDGQWMTADDPPTNYTETEFAIDGQQEEVTGYLNAGPDSIWFTADDEPSYSTLYSTY